MEVDEYKQDREANNKMLEFTVAQMELMSGCVTVERLLFIYNTIPSLRPVIAPVLVSHMDLVVFLMTENKLKFSRK